MNRKKIASHLKGKSMYTAEQKLLLDEIDKAREGLKTATQYFNSVNNSRLVDYAIYMEEAAKAKYVYLLSEAKKNGLKVNCYSVLEELNVG